MTKTKEPIQLSDKFDYKRLLRFTLPSIAMMLFMSIYGVVDGFFVSNFVGETAFAAVNFIIPYTMLLGAVGFMLGTGGSAYISKLMGEGRDEDAKRVFSMLIYVTVVMGAVLSVVGVFTVRPVAMLLGAEEGEMLENAVTYGTILFIAMPSFMLQYEFQALFVTAEKPKLGLAFTVAAGVTNMVLDAILVPTFQLFGCGLIGAAIATSMSQSVGGLLPLIYFARPNSSLLRLVPAGLDLKALLKISVNGSSELMSNISMSIVSMLYNAQLLHYAGEPGVAAYGVLMYVNFIFISMFIGYAVGIAPVVGYNFGAGNKEELRSLRRKSTLIMLIMSVGAFLVSEALAYPLAFLFVRQNPAILEMTVRGFVICSFAFLFVGLAIFVSSFFTALNDGITSALLSFARTLIFQVAAVMILPIFMELDGIWLSIVVAELLAVILNWIVLLAMRKRYGY